MILSSYYKIKHPGKPVPPSYKRSLLGELWHLLQKFICQNMAPHCVSNFMRIRLYRLCGFKIGKGTFIGMKCYLDDMCAKKIIIGDHVTISYGVYFACHGRKQKHNMIVIKDNAYIGMRASIIAPNDIEIGECSIVGAMTLINKSVPSGKTAVGVPCRILDKE